MEIHLRGEFDQRTYRHIGKPTLTETQFAVLRRVAIGQPDGEIAKAMHVAESTTRRHVRDILSKLDARNRAHAVHIAHTKGILP